MLQATEDFDGRALRDAFGHFATGITVVTTRDAQGHDVGLTVNSFTSVSLEPPLVLFCLANDGDSAGSFGDETVFAVNVLEEAQRDLSHRFAQSDQDKFEGLQLERWSGDAPLLPGCIAHLECHTWQRIDAGDHVVIIGQVLRLRMGEGGPLLFFRGAYGTLR